MFDIIFIDEASQISVSMFHHIIISIARVTQCPIVFMSSDFGPFVSTGIKILASALELALALELASILHMCKEACKTDQGVM